MDGEGSGFVGFVFGILAWLAFGDLYPKIMSYFEGDKLSRQIYLLDKFSTSNPIGSDRDVWIIKDNVFGFPEKVGLVFGFTSDFEFCSEIATAYMQTYPQSSYRCEVNFSQKP